MSTLHCAAGFVLVLALAPFATAQGPLDGEGVAVATQGCARQCQPTDDDVNGAEPATGDASAKTILYGHFQDILNRAPLNTQPPGEREDDLSGGFLAPTVIAKAGDEVIVHTRNNWFHMYSSPGLVEILDGEWRTHQEPGLAETVNVVGDEMTLYFYVSASPLPGTSAPGVGDAVVDAMPQVALFARVETGRHPMSSRSTVIAEGDTGKDDLGSLPTGPGRVTVLRVPGQPPVYEFQVPMKVLTPTIPSVWGGADGFTLSVNVYQLRVKEDGPAKDWEFTQADWRAHVGPSTPPRVVLDVGKPLVTKAATLTVFQGDLFARWSFSSPWGSYDVDDRSLEFRVSGPTEVPPDLVRLVALRRSVDHNGHFLPVNATWRIGIDKVPLADGEYTIDASILNLQHTYKATQEFSFSVAGGRILDVQSLGGVAPAADGSDSLQAKGDAPSASLALLLGSTVAVAALRRRVA